MTTDTNRVDTVVGELFAAVRDIIRRHRLTYAEYDAVKSWLVQVGESGEWPMLLDIWFEHVVEEVDTAGRLGSKGTIEGPAYIAGAPELPATATLPMRPGEPGVPLLVQGQVRSVAGTPLPGTRLEVWGADADGRYSQFEPDIPEWNLRGTVIADADGRFAIRTIQPAPYQIPTDGACGKLIAAAGWHAWRPAHVHVKVSAPGHVPVTTQLYFAGGEHVEDDVATAVKPELILRPTPSADGAGLETSYDFVLDLAG